MKVLSVSNSNAISLLRIFSTIIIVVCHILQTYNNNYAYVFNIGVQIFFVLSGLLYGYKEIEFKRFWYGRIKNIYVPFLIFSLVMALLNVCLLMETVEIKQLLIYILGVQGLPFTFIDKLSIDGLGHLWYITAILLCYAITPVLQSIRHKYDGGGKILITITLLAIIEFFIEPFFVNQFSWFYLYIMGYLFSTMKPKHVIAILLILFFFILGSSSSISWIDLKTGTQICLIYKNSVAIFVVYLIMVLSNLINVPTYSLVKLFDRASLYVYFTHYPLTRLPYCLLFITPFVSLNVLLTIIATICCTLIIRSLTTKVVQIIFEKKLK